MNCCDSSEASALIKIRQKMQATKNNYSNPNPKLYANFLSRLIFGWLFPLFKYRQNHILEKRDLYDVLPEDLSEKLGNNLESCWNNELQDASKNKKEPKFLKAIRNYLGWSYMKYGINMFLLNIFVRVSQPLVLGNLVSQFYPNSTNTSLYTYLYTSILVGLIISQVFLVQHANFGLSVVGMRLRIACSSLIYRKMTKLSCASVHQVSGGTILNLLSSDVAKFETLFVSFHYVWIVPLQAIVMVYLMWQRIGVASLIGITFMTLTTIPFQFLIGRTISKLRLKAAIMTDKRILIVSELIDGIRTIKMYVWERPFEKLVSLMRRREISIIKLCFYLKGISLASLMYTNLTTIFFTLLVYVLQGNAISANTVYVITYYYYYLRLTLTYHFPNAVNLLAEAGVSVRRIERFLLLEEVEKTIESTDSGTDAGQVLIRHASAKWSEKLISNTLSDISISVIPKKLYAVVGPVGAGKSSLLKLILNELRATSGNVSISGSISYASQDPWLFVGSVRSNILFGEAYDETKYREVVRVCALERDFECLPHGDRTLIGDRGAALSGGQCARVNLARAVYRNADVYLLDDPLSVVDTQVGKQLFCDCIDGLLKNKTRILVTHQLQYLKRADFIVFLNNGRIEFLGTFREFQLKELLRHSSLFCERFDKSENCLVNNGALLDEQNPYECGESRFERIEEEPQESEELLEHNDVKTSLYWKYFRSGGSYFVLISTIMCFIIAQALLSASTYWIAYWTQYEDHLLLNTSITSLEKHRYLHTLGTYNSLWILGGLIFSSTLMCIVSNVLLFKRCMDANKSIHQNMIARLLQAPIRFFQTNPSGRILNRFSKDTAAVDETLPVTMLQMIQWCSIVVGNLVQVLIVNWLIAFPLCIVVYFYAKVKDIYLATAQNIKRLEGIVKSPVFSHVNSSLAGLLTIRACNAEASVRREFDDRQNDHTAAHFLVVASSVAFGFWIDAVSVAFVILVSYSLVVCAALGGISIGASYVGLALTQVIGLCGSMQSCMKNYGDTVTQMTNIERMQQITELESEEPPNDDDERLALQRPPMFWPAKGEVKFERVSLRYSPDAPLALKDLNFAIKPGTKVGIIGRTGAGKSSLVSALFRLMQFDGSIFIDGIDITKLSLRDLREKISIIPQESKIFTTSVRRNLDAYDRFDDSLLWSALGAVDLKHVVSSLDGSLEHGGTNLSVGQRQLLCLARTILENNRILVLDEATANVDAVTDELIRRTVRRQFRDCTVITIAHRLNTIMDSDRILVLDEGRLVEYDEPKTLLARSNGYLVRMLEQTGKSMAEHLRSIVEQGTKEDTENESIR